MNETSSIAPPSCRPPLRAALAALAGCSVAAGGAPLEAWALPWAGAVLLHALWGDAARSPRPLRSSAVVGVIAGLAANLVSMPWAVELFERHAFLPMPLALLLSGCLWLAQSLPLAAAGLLRGAIHRASGVPPALATLVATLVAGGLTPMFFPWRLGTSEISLAPMAAWASLSGVSAIDLMLVGPAALAAEALRSGSWRGGLVSVLALTGALGGGALLGAGLERERDGRELVRVGVAHTVLSIPERQDPLRWERDHLALLASTVSLEADGAELVLWPETAYPFAWPRERTRDTVGLESLISRGVRGPVAFGSLTWSAEGRFNSVVGLEPDGRLAGIADKRVLMPFSERVPLSEWLRPYVPSVPEGLVPARAPAALRLGGLTIGVLNCYEDLDAEHTRWLVARESPDLLTNHTNDAWFGEQAAELHLFLARLRAIEAGRDLVRAVNGGVSAHVAATGEVLARRGPGEPGGFVAHVRRGGGATSFVRFGDSVLASALGAVLALLLPRRARRPLR